MNKTWMKLGLLAWVAMWGCNGEHAVQEELCEHLQKGPGVAVAAEDQSPPAISADHRRYDLTLPEVSTQRAGSVTLAVDEAGDWVFGLSRAIPLEVRSSGGAQVAVKEQDDSPGGCEELATTRTFELGVGTYSLRLGPTDHATVSVVVEHEGH